MQIIINGKTEFDYNANFIHKEISEPAPKLETVEIPLSDGFVNASALLSDHPFFAPRTITLGFELRGARYTWPMTWSKMLNDLHGQSVTLVFQDDSTWYWQGTASVGPLEDHGSTAGVTITVNAQPFKRTQQKTPFVSTTISTDTAFVLNCPYPRAYPEFIVSTSGFTVNYDNETWSLPVGTSTAYGLVLFEGANTLTVHGVGDVEINYVGGSL